MNYYTNLFATLWHLVGLLQIINQVSSLQTRATTIRNNNPTASKWGGWRVALNIGREPSTTMPNSWASSGARFPLVMPCNFTNDGVVKSISGDVRYTIQKEGEVIKPVLPGSWSLKNNRTFTFSLTFPQELKRNGVELGPDCELICEGLIYTIKDLEKLNQAYYDARSMADESNVEVKEIKKRKEAPKKWNFDTNRWEKRHKDESIISNIGKRLKQLKNGIFEDMQSRKRPKLVELSLECGEFPDMDCLVYIKKDGVVRLKGGGIVGRWGAEPINDNPVSYYRPSY